MNKQFVRAGCGTRPARAGRAEGGVRAGPLLIALHGLRRRFFLSRRVSTHTSSQRPSAVSLPKKRRSRTCRLLVRESNSARAYLLFSGGREARFPVSPGASPVLPNKPPQTLVRSTTRTLRAEPRAFLSAPPQAEQGRTNYSGRVKALAAYPLPPNYAHFARVGNKPQEACTKAPRAVALAERRHSA